MSDLASILALFGGVAAVIVAYTLVWTWQEYRVDHPRSPRRGRHRVTSSPVPGPTSSLGRDGRWSA